MEATTEISKDIGYAVTITTGGYFTAELYVAVPRGAVDPDKLARIYANGTLKRLAQAVPEAKLEITAVRRVS